MLFTSEGIINIRNEKWKDDLSPIDSANNCFADIHYSKAYLRHLMISGEMLGAQIATLHNLSFYLKLMDDVRSSIIDGTFGEWKKMMIPKLGKRL
jgi:queuine tRNA-ribosyltransferase